jgi:polysaccharide deacetylase family protein (PEP-CTERM system associated)
LLNAFTVDVEDYFQVSAFESTVPRSDWADYPSRVVANTHRLLRLLNRRGVRSTFFVLGWVAHRFPGLVRDIHGDGHEIGSHSYWHRLVYHQQPAEFVADLQLSCRVLADILGAPITLYRAPSFSITQQSWWAIDLLVQQGIDIDSSVFPIHHDRYGMPDAIPTIHHIQGGSRPLCEFPPTTVRWGGMKVPAGGGGYLRLYPLWFTVELLKRRNRGGDPFLCYVHPWELDIQQPRISGVRWQSRMRHYVNLDRVEQRLDNLLKRFRFGSISDVVARYASPRDTRSTGRDPLHVTDSVN